MCKNTYFDNIRPIYDMIEDYNDHIYFHMMNPRNRSCNLN